MPTSASKAPQKYRKKPVVNEAMQWTGDNIWDLWAWIGALKLYGPVTDDEADVVISGRPSGSPAILYVEATDEWINIEVGEWIIKDRLGFYPCKNEVFIETYELSNAYADRVPPFTH